jgi:hypothetical protein
MSNDFWKGYTTAAIVFLGSLLLMGQCAKADDGVITIIAMEAITQGLDPAVAIAVARVESSLRPNARGKYGEVGLFQIMPQYATPASYTVEGNVRDGVSTLIYWREHCPVKSGIDWVSCYNQGARHPKYPHLLPYVKKVKAAL